MIIQVTFQSKTNEAISHRTNIRQDFFPTNDLGRRLLVCKAAKKIWNNDRVSFWQLGQGQFNSISGKVYVPYRHSTHAGVYDVRFISNSPVTFPQM
jgi:hypothetical protein